MSREKQIEEMANDLRKSEFWYFDDTDCDFELERKKTAENLYNAGYRKASEVAREIVAAADELINLVCMMSGIEIAAVGGKYLELRKKYTEGGK